MIRLPPEQMKDAMDLYERARNYGPHTEDFFAHEEFKRIALALRKIDPTLDDWRVLATILRDAARHLTSNT